MGIDTIDKLQNADIKDLVGAVGAKSANHIKQLSFGIDENPVKATDKPKSIGAEDGFPTVQTEQEIKEKLGILLDRVWDLVLRDGRKPTNVKLTVRKLMYLPDKHNTRESRQTSIIVGSSGNCATDLDSTAKEKIVQTLMSLFCKIIGNESGWLVTLLGISFGGFSSDYSPTKSSITKYFNAGNASVKQSEVKRAIPSSSQETVSQPPTKRQRIDDSVLQELPPDIRQEILNDMDSYVPQSAPGTAETISQTQVSVANCPGDIDPAVFSQLPSEIQEELLQESKRKTKPQVIVDKKPKNLLSYFRKV